jgi:hypothetical protein
VPTDPVNMDNLHVVNMQNKADKNNTPNTPIPSINKKLNSDVAPLALYNCEKNVSCFSRLMSPTTVMKGIIDKIPNISMKAERITKIWSM